MANYVVLSFHETLLHKSDVDLLSGPHWLNDSIISFYFEYLEKIKFKNASDLLFVSPEVTQCIKMVKTEEIQTFLEPLHINRKNFVFFALNDNNSPDMAGGSHWSLLVYSKPEHAVYHYDSLNSHNHSVAWHFATHLVSYLSRKGDTISFGSKDCEQQKNGYDCGIHLIYNTEQLAEYAHEHGEISSCNMSVHIRASDKRTEILGLIKELSKSHR